MNNFYRKPVDGYSLGMYLNKPIISLQLASLIGAVLLGSRLDATTTPTNQIMIEDSANNLEGDPNRTYLDIKRVQMEIDTEWVTLRIEVLGSFPDPEWMLGMGYRFDIQFLENNPKEKTDPQQTIRKISIASGNGKSWDIEYFTPSEKDNSNEYELRLNTGPNELTVIFPTALLQNNEIVSVSTTTEDYPKWTPITRNPSIRIPREEPASLEMR